ncbi:type II toxin-antitoxin system RelE/ParE family toxin [Testudinibacter aquarius]|uniref:Plasmid stabilization system protein ParE n=1 Tax=Testudinibacter aquarius TaxID=1524974 RepID=A0A4V2W2M5_9PAST|nr:type II toxin-antitoxin system RelE/ParE family toxin [Testudinibacter aquarius]TNG90760.1 type II toxin-antitoxin system RelE/ParE family toxin [Pasteurellaceae bacterium USgator41]TNG97041.1 type II toxin-antitoxin system RelE/ParE family toxin [Pasteurellaceae bacterium UScroc12]TNG98393.1 type II toxin-antitoxin system RelE/ParE family toxin [Pasteurellaceae bacterium UScroc31]TNH01427.1 type II toxin-antitoxin system RelE/ParE family toxin [Pasteurellaceae bacterium USgator11]KAE952578
MPRLVLSDKTIIDIEGILRNVSEYTSSLASIVKLEAELSEKFEQIAFLPRGFKLQEDGTRHAFCRRYRIVYEYNEIKDEIIILTVLHSLRKYP